MRELWASAELVDYIREELGVPGTRQAALVTKTTTQIATGAVAREAWYLLTSRPPKRCRPAQLIQLFRQHWSIENSLPHVKDRSWDEYRHTLRRPGLGEILAALVNASLNVLCRAESFTQRMSLPLRAKTCAFRPKQTAACLTGHLP